MKKITGTKLIIAVSAFFVIFTNFSFFSHVSQIYQPNIKNIPFILSLGAVLGAVIAFLLSLICFKKSIKPVIIVLLLVTSLAAYFMDSYNTVIDNLMIQNIIKTDFAESMDLVSLRMVAYLLFLGILPSIAVARIRIEYGSVKREFFSRIRLIGISLVIIPATVLAFSGFYASFFREHKPLRYYSNPTYYIYSAGKYIHSQLRSVSSDVLKQIGMDAMISPEDTRRELIIFVVGEAARADRFSLNGYSRDTNPLLSKREGVINFSNTWSCGTSTAVSVPCMFSMFGQSGFTNEKGDHTENLLDILKRAGVNILWRDNNSDSKGVALRVEYQNFKTPELNPVCDGDECRDEGMLSGLQDYIDRHEKGDIFIVLHQMGNHGPAYYKRYPASFEKFTPTCKTNQLEDCTDEEITNAYDNAILYTDYFLSKVIDLLDMNNDKFETVMFYISDHGESLGEKGIYLHGLPNMIAPDTQKHVPFLMWFGGNIDKDEIDLKELTEKRDIRYSQDNLFHTILGLMEIDTSLYNKKLDMIDHKDE